MARRKWIRLPGGRLKRWKKSRSERRPGTGTARWGSEVPPRWYRRMLNHRERALIRRALHGDRAEGRPYVHPRAEAWYW
jgi:hypothetical protein